MSLSQHSSFHSGCSSESIQSKGIPAQVLLFCYQHWVPLVFLKWEVAGVEERGRMESLPINAEHKREATQRDTSSETELFGFSFAKW